MNALRLLLVSSSAILAGCARPAPQPPPPTPPARYVLLGTPTGGVFLRMDTQTGRTAFWTYGRDKPWQVIDEPPPQQ